MGFHPWRHRSYGGTFLVFSDYCRPSIRLSALMGKRVIYVMTHDSIGLGEDGPTHQPVEQLAALRAMPNLNVFRPADSVDAPNAGRLPLAPKRRPRSSRSPAKACLCSGPPTPMRICRGRAPMC
jgi:transketolase